MKTKAPIHDVVALGRRLGLAESEVRWSIVRLCNAGRLRRLGPMVWLTQPERHSVHAIIVDACYADHLPC